MCHVIHRVYGYTGVNGEDYEFSYYFCEEHQQEAVNGRKDVCPMGVAGVVDAGVLDKVDVEKFKAKWMENYYRGDWVGKVYLGTE